MHFQQVPEVPDQQKKKKDDGAREDDADEAFCQNIQGNEGRDAPAGKKARLSRLPAVEEKIEGESDPEADGDIRYENPRQQVRAAGSKKDDSGPKSCAFGEKAPSKKIQENRDSQSA